MSKPVPTITISEVIEGATDEGAWINAEFRGIVRNATSGQGRKPSKADVCDADSPGIKISIASFGADLRDYEGALCHFHGNGMKAKNYKGKIEVTMGKESLINRISDAPKSAPVSAAGGPADATRASPGPAARSVVDPTIYFHREMSKMSLGYLHCLQYADNVRDKRKDGITVEQHQACVASLFIEGNKKGLFEKVPKLRELSPSGIPFAFVPPAPAAEDPAAVEKAKAEAAAKAAEAARIAHEEAEKLRKQKELDEDVPF